MEYPNCEECKWYECCVTRKLCLGIEYCFYQPKEE